MNRSSSSRALAALSFAGVVALAAACGEGDAAEQAASRVGGPAGARVVAVEAVPVVRGTIARSLTVAGVVHPLREIAVNSRLSAALTAVNVQEGDRVRQGAVLARLDDAELQAQLDAAQAAYDVARAALDRSTQLRERKVITLPEFERDRTAFASAKAQLDQIRTRISYATVRAPLSGVVTQKLVEAGDAVAPQTHLFTIADVSTLVVQVGVSELDVPELHAGDRVEIVVDALPTTPIVGRIRRVFPTADPNTRLVTVEVALAGAATRLVRPGFLARTTFALDAKDGVLLVPAGAIVGGAGSDAVFVVEDGKALRRSVSTGMTSNGRVEVLAGLSEGEQVVTAGNNALRDGTPVRIMPPGTAAPAPADARGAAVGGEG